MTVYTVTQRILSKSQLNFDPLHFKIITKILIWGGHLLPENNNLGLKDLKKQRTYDQTAHCTCEAELGGVMVWVIIITSF